MKPNRKDRKSGKFRGKRKNPGLPAKDLAELSRMIGDTAGNLALNQACTGMTFEHKMVVSAMIGSYIRPLLGYPKSKTITIADENTEDTVSPG